MRLLIATVLAGLGVGVVGCGPSETSVALVFPNDVVMKSIRRIRVAAYPPSAGGAASDRDCRDFEDLAREGMDPVGTPVRGDFDCNENCADDWFSGEELPKIDAGRQIVYVLAYASTEEDATPVLEGCTDRFDSRGGSDEVFEVPIDLHLVIPKSARLVKTAGDRQVGRAGEKTPIPLQVRIEAESPGGAGYTYFIPGIPVTYTTSDEGFELIGGAASTRVETLTGAEGLAEVEMRLSPMAGTARVRVTAEALKPWIDNELRAQADFSLSVTDPSRFAPSQVIQGRAGALPIRVALGKLDGPGPLDLVVLSCRGSQEGCALGKDAVAPFGTSEATVVLNVGVAPEQLDVPQLQGILPAGLAVADFQPEVSSTVDEIAIVHGRRAECQGRVGTPAKRCPYFGVADGEPCPCEGSEVLILGHDGTQLKLQNRHTMTASNAIAAVAYLSPDTDPQFGLAIVAQGRSINTQPCSQAGRCLPHDPEVSAICVGTPESCGCPTSERCECTNCADSREPGVCVARDKVIDLLEFNAQTETSFNRDGCQRPLVACDVNNAQSMSTCSCLDAAITGNRCDANDGCGCKVPRRIHVGDSDAPVLPLGIAAGPLASSGQWDIIVPSIGGLELVENLPGSATFEWRGEPIVNAPIHEAVVLDLDGAAERDLGAPQVGDVAWISRAGCLAGANFELSCPVWRALDEGQSSKGCMGVYHSDGQDSLFSLRTPSKGGCRRHELTERPDGICSGNINSDAHPDVVVASGESNDILIYAGDGRGGLLDPPERFPLPAGGVGGPVVCGDLDSDGSDDVVVVDANTGTIYVLRSMPSS